jgi:hypothetical protein
LFFAFVFYLGGTPSVPKYKQKWSTKDNVFGSKFSPNTLIFVDPFFLIFWDVGSSILAPMCFSHSLLVDPIQTDLVYVQESEGGGATVR